MFDFIKALFRPKEISNPFLTFPKSTVEVPMPPVKPTKKDCQCRDDLQEVKYKKMEELAYFLAEADGFRKEPLSYWLQAEEIVRKEVG